MGCTDENGKKDAVGVELKYCEHCGGLFVREKGAGLLYCEKCQPKVADLPVPKRKGPGRIHLPVRPRTVVEQYRVDEETELEAAGGVA